MNPLAKVLLLLLAVHAGGCACGTPHTNIARGRIEAQPASLDFGTTPMGIAVQRTVTLLNQGDVAVQVSAMTVGGEAPGHFSVKPPASLRIEAGSSFEVAVVYLPSSAGNHSARLFVESDANNAPELVVPLSGFAVPADRCAGVTCGAPPGPCFREVGTCDGGTCTYAVRDAGTPCDDGDGCTEGDACTSAGACVGTAKSCQSPPAPVCADATTRHQYSSPGTCALGACVYSSSNAPCAASEVCQAGACSWNDATLLSLAVAPRNIAFAPAQTAYAVSVPPGTTSVVLTATVSQPARAVVHVQGVVTTSGTPATVPLPSAVTSIAVRVDAESGASMTYTVVVTVAVTAQQAYLKASNTETFDGFGNLFALSADGTTLAVAAIREDSSATGVGGNQADNSASESGAIYVFTRSGPTWVQQAYLKASNTGANDLFGSSVALSADGNTLAVGACDESSNATGVGGNQADNSASQSGAVYVFTRTAGAWSQQAYVKASNTGAGDRFGISLALSGDGSTLAVGASDEASNATGIGGNQADNSAPGAGAVYVFTRGAAWTQQAYLKASNTGAHDQFGVSVALGGDGNTLVVGADVESSNATGVNGNQANDAAPASGAAYVFVRGGATWAQQAYLKASNTEANDAFGLRVAVSADGSTVAVAAPSEGSNASGVGGSQTNNLAPLSGAAYVFARTGTTWAQQAYVKASNTGSVDYFGRGLALSGDGQTLAVGAFSEDSNARGVGGSQADNSATNSGAVYVFNRSGAVWAQQAYVKASNADAFDYFGDEALALSADGSTLVAGAYGESSNATGVGGNQADNSAMSSGAVYVFTQ